MHTAEAKHEIVVRPSTASWRSYKHVHLSSIPNYWNIESEDYWHREGTGFSISGYIHDDDVRLMLAAKDLLAALREITDAYLSLHDGEETFIAARARAAIAKAESK